MANTNYYGNIDYTYQPYQQAGTPFGTPTGTFPTTTNVEQNAGNPPTTTLTGNQPVTGGLFSAPAWFDQPQDAVIRAMKMQGMNPSSFSPVTQQILRNASNLTSALFGQLVGGNAPGTVDLTDNTAMLGRLGQMINTAATGGKVFGQTGPQQMANFSRWQASQQAGSMDPSVNYVTSILQNPTQASNLAQSLMFSGLAPQYQRAAGAPFLNLTDYYQRLLEQGQTYDRSIIDVLLGAPVYGRPAGSPGVPAPFQASAWRYAPDYQAA